jgi:hypothetical protein
MSRKTNFLLHLCIPLALAAMTSACNFGVGVQITISPQYMVITASGTTGQSAPPSASSTVELTPTQTPSVTFTPSITATPTMEGVTMTAGQDLSCVTGPKWDLYDWVAIIKQGEMVTLLARSTPEWGEYYYVRMGNGTECWVYGGSSTKNGDPSSLPIKEAPPTPTPKTLVDYSVSYLTTSHCGATYYFRFHINNTGTVALESIRIVITDNTMAATFTHESDSFRSYNGCGIESYKPSLPPGQGTSVANVIPGELGYNPAGHSITATFTICPADCLMGTCVNRTINFTA